MGTFERTYEVDGERFELYRQGDDSAKTYQLVDDENLPVGERFDEVPSEDVVAALVRAGNDIAESAA